MLGLILKKGRQNRNDLLGRRNSMRVSARKLAFVIVVISAAAWAADDPLMGTWKLDPAKSKYSPGPPPKSTMTKNLPYGKDGLHVIVDGVDAQGNPTHTEYTAQFDGKEYPVKNDPYWDTAILKRVDAYTMEATYKKAGKVASTSRVVVSKDGKTRMVTGKSTNPQGQPVLNVGFYERQ